MSEGRAILLLGYGGPEKTEDVRPFIENIVRGRNVPPARIDQVVDQYMQIGGRSPFIELTRKQAAALETAMTAENTPARVYLGMLFSEPTLPQALNKISADGFTRAVAIIMAPHRTEASFGRYVEAVSSAIEQLESAGLTPPMVSFIDPWHAEKEFADAIADRIAEKLNTLDPKVLPKTRIIFTAHSVPTEMSEHSRYAEQIEETAAAAFSSLRKRHAADGTDWVVGYQSRSGPPQQPWLEPDVSARLAEAKQSGKTHAVVTPIGFLVDHVEVLYDLDVLAKNAAADAGIEMLRAQTVCDHPAFIWLLATAARHKFDAFYARS